MKAVRDSPVEQIEVPTLFIYSDFDQVVKARHTDALMRRWGSPIKHRICPAPMVGDNNHVLTGAIVRPDSTERVSADILNFIKALPAKL